MKKKILSLDDLVRFCEENKFTNFNAQDQGYRLSVHVPATFELQQMAEDYLRADLMKLKIRLVHTGRNRNGSMITEEDANKSKWSIANRPILGTIHQLSDGSWDFAAHDIEIIEHEDGTQETVYLEKQIGSFTEEEPFWEEEDGRKYLCAYGVIPTEYTKAAEIIQRKNGTKVSAELSVGQMVYNVQEGCLQLIDWYVSGATMLGRSLTTEEEVEEGMVGARADITSFSEEENSIVEQLSKMQKSMDALAAKFESFSNTKSLGKGGKPTMDNLLKQDEGTENNIAFTDESTENVENDFNEGGEGGDTTPGSEDDVIQPTNDSVFEEEEGNDSDSEDTGNSSDTNDTTGGSAESEDGSEEDLNDSDIASLSSDDTSGSVAPMPKKTTDDFQKEYKFAAPNGMEFAVSMNQMISAIYDYVNSVYSEQDNDWYDVEVYEDNVVITGWCSGKSYRQKYAYDNNTVVLLDTREEVYKEYLNKSEQDALALMRGSFNELQAFKEQKEAEAREEVLNRFEEQLADDEGFAVLKNDSANFSAEELELRCNALIGQKTMKTFAKETKKSSITLPFFKNDTKKESPYGGMFRK